MANNVLDAIFFSSFIKYLSISNRAMGIKGSMKGIKVTVFDESLLMLRINRINLITLLFARIIARTFIRFTDRILSIFIDCYYILWIQDKLR